MVDFVVNTGQTRVELDKLMQSVAKLGANTDALEAKLDGMGAQWAGTVLKMTGAARDAEARFRALAGEANALKTVLQNADIVNRYSKAMLDLNAAVEQSTLNAIKLESAIQLTNQGYRTAELAAKERLKTAEAANTAEVRSEETFRRSAIALEQLTTITGRLAAIEAERVKGAERIVVEETKQANATKLRAEQTALLNTEVGKKNAVSKVEYDSAVRMATAEAKQAAALQETAQAIELLQSPEGQRLARLRATQAALAQQAVFNERQAATTEKLRRELEFLNSAEGKNQAELRAQLNAEQQAARAMSDRLAKVEALRRELDFLRSAEGKYVVALEQQVAAERKAAASSSATAVQMKVGNQLTASLRAGLMGLRTSIGMYTSSTIIAASAVFGLARAFRSGLEAGTEFTASMARARAIMAATPQEFSALQAQVEALGAATQFSSTQVAEAAVELAKVGLSASQAITALRPVLDIATLGNTDIANAAKLATDVMFVFGKRVGDLTDISDVMATAIARSSTNIDELVKGLTYAGPAAHAAGISMRDTVAAMEALANAGIRGSRAGTALRMMIDRLADPTAKGAAALQKMGVSLLDLQGKAKSLTEVLKEFQAAQKRMGGPEFLAGLGDIFGVRQASAAANLISNTDNMVKFRKELELSTGASDKMVQSLRDVAKFDWENLTSAFQALQISVFQDNEYQIRGFIETLRHFFDFLNERIGDGGVTRLESYITRLTHLGEAVAAAFAVKYLIKFSSSLAATAGRLAEQSLGYRFVAQAARGAEVATDSYTASVIRQTVAVDASAVGLKAWAGRAALANAGTAGLAAGASRLGGLLSAGGAILGWVGIIAAVGYGLWEVYKAVTDTGPKTSEELKKRTEEAKQYYKELKDASDEMTKQQEKVNLARSVDFQRQAVVDLQKNISDTERYRDEAMKAAKTDAERSLVAEKYATILDVQKEKLKDATKALADYLYVGASVESGSASSAEQESTQIILRMNELRRKIEDVQTAADGTKLTKALIPPADQARLQQYIAQLNDLGLKFAALANAAAERKKAGGLTADEAIAAADKIVADATSKQFDEHADKALKNANALEDMAKAAAKSRKDMADARQAVLDAKAGIGDLTEAENRLATAAHNGAVIQGTFAAALGDLARNSHDLAEKYDIGVMAPGARKAAYQKKLKDAQAALTAVQAASTSAGFKDPALNPNLALDYNRFLTQRNEAAEALGLFNKPVSTKAVDNFLSNLREQLNPIAEAAKKANEQLEKLKSYKGDDKALLAGQIEFTRLKDSLQFSTDPIEKQIQAIEDWKNKQLALNEATKDATVKEQQRIQILREAESAENNLKASLESRKEALEDYVQNLDDQNTALRRQMQDRVSAIGMGQQEAQQQAALTKVYRDQTDAIAKLHTERDRAVKRAMDSDAPNKGSEVEAIKADYAAREQALRDHFAEQVLITKQGYQDLLRAQGSVTLGIKGGLSQVIEDGTNVAGKMSQAVTQGFNDMTDAVVNFAKTGKFSLKAFAADFAEMMLRMELAALEAKLAMMILGLFAPQSTGTVDTGTGQWTNINWGAQYGSTGGTFSGIGAAGAHGLAFDRGSIVAMAKGGLLTRPTLFPMANGGVALGGEAGTEAIMPLGKTPSGDLGIKAMLGGGGGDVFNFQTIVNVNSDGSSQSSTTSDNSRAGRELAGLIEAKAREVVVRATQPGGILWKQRNGVTA